MEKSFPGFRYRANFAIYPYPPHPRQADDPKIIALSNEKAQESDYRIAQHFQSFLPNSPEE